MTFDEKCDKFAHSYIYIGIVAFISLFGWYFDSLNITYICMACLLVLTPFLTKDIKTLLIFLPFGMTGFRHFFFFNSIPIQIFIVGGALILSLLIYIIRYIRTPNKAKFKINIITYSLIGFGIICLLATLVRNIFYNEAAFIDYQEYYNIAYGYLTSVAIIALALFSILITNMNDYKNDNSIFERIFYVFGLYLLLQLVIAGFEGEFSLKPYSRIGWCDKNTMAMAIEFCLPFLAYIFSKNYKRVDSFIIMALLILYIMMGDSRGGQVTTFLMCFLLLYLIVIRLKHKFVIYFSLIILGALSALILYFTIPTLKASIDRLFDRGMDVTGRDIFWGWIIDYTYKTPSHILFGGSPSYLFEAWPPFAEQFYGAGINNDGVLLCHNTFMTAMAACGTLGVIFMAYHFVEAGVGIFKHAGERKLELLILLFYGFVHGMIDNTFFNPLFMVPYIFILSCYTKGFKEII